MRNALLYLSLVFVVGGWSGFAGAETSFNKVSEATKKEVAEFKSKMSKKLDELDKEIEKIESKTNQAKKNLKQNAKAKVRDLKDLRKDISEKLSELGDTSEDKVADLKLSIEHKYEKLQNEVEKLFN